MSQVKFLFGIHNHQPVGNFEHVIENTYNYSYKPFIDLLYEYPQIKFSMHCSGILWDYFFDRHPEFIKIVKEMVERGQIELISGGYYEPILSSISQKDRINQIKMMNKFLFKTFGVNPEGLWLTERIWEQNIVKDIVSAGIKYTLVDDYHFYSAGLEKRELTGYYVTEEEGCVLYIFPISQMLRYYIPFRLVEEVIEFFKKFSFGDKNEVVGLTMCDDGEKFGGWPKTYDHVYKDGWLKKFLNKICENQNWLSTMTYSEFIKVQLPKGRIYLPTASYFEMGEWTLPQKTQEIFEDILKEFEHNPNKEKYLQFMRGGYWKNFLTKYSESNNMHKKMLFVSDKVNKIKKIKNYNANVKGGEEKTKPIFNQLNMEQITTNLYKAQCNCAYWHGIFGGLYLPHLREAIYEHLIKAEKELYKKDTVSIIDYDKDGLDEIVIENISYEAIIKPSYGGSVIELDLKDYNKNLLNVLTRRKEAYHRKLIEYDKKQNVFNSNETKTIHDLVLSKEKNLSQYLFYDWYNRYSFLDHFLHPDTKYNDFVRCQYGEVGDFVLEPYEIIAKDEKNFVTKLSRKGNVWLNNERISIEVVKEYKFAPNISCKYMIKNNSDKKVELWFMSENNLMISYPEKNNLGEIYTEKWISKDNENGYRVEILVSKKTNFWIFPIETISISESGFERTYQGVCVAPNYKITLGPNEKNFFEIQINIK